ncbi:MAG: type II toxin-antitoxin system RelE family toxin [Actinomycetota bacterium]
MSDAPIPIAWTPTARRALSQLPEKAATAAVEFIYGALAGNPARVGKPLRHELEGLHSARRGDFRIIYRVSDVVTIVAIDHRADIYRRR